MEAVVPWARLTALIEPHYPKAGPKGGRPAMPLEVMLRVYCLLAVVRAVRPGGGGFKRIAIDPVDRL